MCPPAAATRSSSPVPATHHPSQASKWEAGPWGALDANRNLWQLAVAAFLFTFPMLARAPLGRKARAGHQASARSISMGAPPPDATTIPG